MGEVPGWAEPAEDSQWVEPAEDSQWAEPAEDSQWVESGQDNLHIKDSTLSGVPILFFADLLLQCVKVFTRNEYMAKQVQPPLFTSAFLLIWNIPSNLLLIWKHSS